MSHSSHSGPSHSVHGTQSNLLKLGGALGIAGCFIGLLVFFGACFGFSMSLPLSILPLTMGSIGFVLTIVGGLTDPSSEGPSVAAGLFINLASIVGALMEMAAWLNWKIFA